MAENPWLGIPARDYEGHMGPAHADQLAPLSASFGEVYRQVRPARLALLGCATGNGLEHVDPAVTRTVVAVDVQPDYVALTRARYPALGPALDVRCADLTTCALPPAGFDLIHAALIFEHVDPAVLAARIAAWLAPGGVAAVVLQIDGEGVAPVTPSPYASIATLQGRMHLVTPPEVARLLGAHGLREVRSWVVPLRGGKGLHAGLYGR
jgi:hypothetical protein